MVHLSSRRILRRHEIARARPARPRVIGAGAVIAAGVLLARIPFTAAIRYCGENSLVIYLAFFMFMAAARTLLLKFRIVDDLGSISLAVTAAAVIGPLLLFWAVRRTPAAFLFRRPAWARLSTGAKAGAEPVVPSAGTLA